MSALPSVPPERSLSRRGAASTRARRNARARVCVARPVLTSAGQDERWPAIVAALETLRHAGRRSIRIVDAACGTGALLMRTACHARSLGFVAIEARGIAAVANSANDARARASVLSDPAIGLSFEVADVQRALVEEAAFPVDILLCDARDGEGEGDPDVAAAIAAATQIVIDRRTVFSVAS